MARMRIVFSLLGLCLGAFALPGAGAANSLGDVDGLPFFGRPYPYGYVYHRPPAECFELTPVNTPDGMRYQINWICNGHVTAKY